jgi:hypothetical protein
LPGSADASAIIPDPVFNLIEAHRAADAAHWKALQVQTRFERRHGTCARAWEISEKPCNEEDGAFEASRLHPRPPK